MTNETNAVDLATELTVAWLANPNTRTSAADVPAFLRSMHEAVSGLGAEANATSTSSTDEDHVRAVSVRKSLASRDHIISMIDGKPYKSLRRHLSGHGLTADQYRARYNLKPDYPMVAAGYSENRRAMALRIGLGRKAQPEAAEPAAAEPATKRARAKKPAAPSKK